MPRKRHPRPKTRRHPRTVTPAPHEPTPGVDVDDAGDGDGDGYGDPEPEPAPEPVDVDDAIGGPFDDQPITGVPVVPPNVDTRRVVLVPGLRVEVMLLNQWYPGTVNESMRTATMDHNGKSWIVDGPGARPWRLTSVPAPAKTGEGGGGLGLALLALLVMSSGRRSRGRR